MNFPEQIKQIIKDKPYTQDNIGMTDSQVLIFDDMVLKIEKRSEWKEMFSGYKTQDVVNVMNWLQNYNLAPKVLCFCQTPDFDYLLMTKIDGKMACDTYYLENSDLLLELIASTLKTLWSLDVKTCPRNITLETKLNLATYFVENNLVDVENVDPKTLSKDGFKNPAALLQWLKENKPKNYEPVLSHGDFCLPNIFFKNNKLSALIDLGETSIADKYQDIALCYRSLTHNFNGTFGGKIYPSFNPDKLFEKLNLTPNWEKLRYYTLLDELF